MKESYIFEYLDAFNGQSSDEIDTAMGNATDLADVSITITITATQID